ncbi:glycosyltransferase [Cypionkella sp.]|uniref:glycosyltransferase n=1 Tax=Cypionkella sp. TaxID=2811411 RepID=UPI00271797EE|nr:glycosyltransferase [Cypionkella sp.]MDO8983803.1 glycosyltransferase [Cypionkella sp.]MDP2051639.1 glycosyltransferase [Cypionkella sp.]
MAPATDDDEFLRCGIASFASGALVDAHKAFRLALTCAPDNGRTHALIANTYLRLGAPALALHHAQTALSVLPNDLDARVALAGAALKLKNFALVRDAIKALDPYPQAAGLNALLHLALSLEAGDFESTLFELAEILEVRPEDHFAKELFAQAFCAFQNDSDEGRFRDFIDSIGLQPWTSDPLPAGAWTEPEASSIDIIIPIFNAIEDLSRCLASVRQWHCPAIGKIILVDDCSDPDAEAWINAYARELENVVVVRNSQNQGFTRSILAGMKKSTAPYVVLLNSDTTVTAGWVDGLWRAMNRRWTTALAGPLSNNAFHQTIKPPILPSHSEMSVVGDLENDPDLAAAFVRLTSRRSYPRVPFLSGFCLLMRRDAFDLAGGLDSEAFPFGYWEVQDLCLKILDLGMDAVIADDVYVHHSSSRSIASLRKTELVKTGLERLSARFSTLRVLAAQQLSATEPEVTHHMRAWHTYETQVAMRQNCSQPVDRPLGGMLGELVVQKAPPASFIGKEVCFFVSHAPLGVTLEYTRQYIGAIRDAGVQVVLCLSTDNMWLPIDKSIEDCVDGLIIRQNVGFDFAAWADMLRTFPEVWDSDRVFFANDSLIGPFASLESIIQDIRTRNGGFFALSECTNSSYHAQSYFFGWNRQNLQAEALRRFWESIANEEDKTQVVLKYEYAIAPLSPALPDPSQHFVFGMETLFGCEPSMMSGFNPTHGAWRRMLDLGFPFVKTDLLRDGVFPIDTSDWKTVCAGHGADTDAVMRHVEGSRINRLPFRKHDQPMTQSDHG